MLLYKNNIFITVFINLWKNKYDLNNIVKYNIIIHKNINNKVLLFFYYYRKSEC
jgi:hypothetical protein